MNPHCECTEPGVCSRHKMNKGEKEFYCCQGSCGKRDCGLSMWNAWESGLLGASAPVDPKVQTAADWSCDDTPQYMPPPVSRNRSTAPVRSETGQEYRERLEKVLAESPTCLVGTRVKLLLFERYRVRAGKSCACEARAKEMDNLGCDGCESQLDRLTQGLLTGAAEKKWIRPVAAIMSGMSLVAGTKSPKEIAEDIVSEAIESERQRVLQWQSG